MNSITKAFHFVSFVSPILFGFASAQMCSICDDGVVPQKSDVLLKFYPGTLPKTQYTCKELYFLGVYNDGSIITPEVCKSLVRLASFSCGCHGDDGNQRTQTSKVVTTEEVDVTVSDEDMMFSTPIVSSRQVNLTEAFHKADTSATPSMAPLQNRFKISDFPSSNPSGIAPSMAPSQEQFELSDFPSSNPTPGEVGRLVPSDQSKSMQPTTTAAELYIKSPNHNKKMADKNADDVMDYHSMLMEILLSLKNFSSRTPKADKPTDLPTNRGKLRGM